MAAKKKKVKKKAIRKGTRADDVALYAEFIGDLIAGLLGTVIALHESRDSNGQLIIEYDEEVDDT